MITIPKIFDSTTPYNHQPRGILSIAQTIDDGYHFIGDMLWGYDDYPSNISCAVSKTYWKSPNNAWIMTITNVLKKNAF